MTSGGTRLETGGAAGNFCSDDARYHAIRRRDTKADGAFFYSVRTTGVYCRPSCAARLANRENIAFHTTPEAAEQAGFRPCKRCRPRETSQTQRHAEAITHACRLIEASDSAPALNALAASVNLSTYHFHRIFKRVTGVTPKAYASARRTQRVATELKSAKSVTDVIYDAGFNAPSRFYDSAQTHLGMTPTRYRAGGAGTEIKFAVGQCSLGAILVAATVKGVCAILLGDEPSKLIRELEDRFPRAVLHGGDPDFEGTVAQVVGLVEHPSRGCQLPLDIGGTAFQQRSQLMHPLHTGCGRCRGPRIIRRDEGAQTSGFDLDVSLSKAKCAPAVFSIPIARSTPHVQDRHLTRRSASGAAFLICVIS